MTTSLGTFPQDNGTGDLFYQYQPGTVIDANGKVWNGPQFEGRVMTKHKSPLHGKRLPFFIWRNWRGEFWANIGDPHGCTIYNGTSFGEVRDAIKGHFEPTA